MLHVITLAITTLLLFSGCVNKRGISHRYYNDCKEYYDLQGYYHKDCDENIIDFRPEPETVDPKDKKVW